MLINFKGVIKGKARTGMSLLSMNGAIVINEPVKAVSSSPVIDKFLRSKQNHVPMIITSKPSKADRK